MKMDGTHKLYTDEITNIWGFSFRAKEGEIPLTLPSPTLTATEGDTVVVMVVNPSNEGHTIHWHGLDVDQANDGVPHTSQYVLHGDTFTYRFIAPHAGNYIYHCHVTTTLHLMMGMYGSFIVYPKQGNNFLYENGPSYEKDYAFLGSELDKSWTDDFKEGGALNEFSPTHFLLNGLEKNQLFDDSTQIIQLEKGKRVGLRLLNIGFSIHRYTFPSDVTALVYTSDGRKLPKPFLVNTLELYPGERYGIILSSSKNVTDYIEVDYLDMYNKAQQSRNYIGINSENFPLLSSEKLFEPKPFISPNPASDFIRLNELPSNNVMIYDSKGKLVDEVSPQINIDVSRLKSGLYFLWVDGQKLPFVKS